MASGISQTQLIYSEYLHVTTLDFQIIHFYCFELFLVMMSSRDLL